MAAVFALTLSLAAADPPIHRIVAVGDLHGDFSAWRDITKAAGLVDSKGRWIGGRTVLVQVGDVVDRGPDSIKIIQDLMRLEREATRAHGQVIALIGNHEAMNMTGDLRYVTAADYQALTDKMSARRREAVYAANKDVLEQAYHERDPEMTSEEVKQAWFNVTPLGYVEHELAWRPEGGIGKWIVTHPAVVLLDGNLFVHGGISPAYAHLSIAEINLQVKDALMVQSKDPQAIINDPLGPLWYRGLVTQSAVVGGAPVADSGTPAPEGGAAVSEGGATTPPAAGSAPQQANAAQAVGRSESGVPPGPSIEDQVDNLLTVYGAKRIVIGHTPHLSGISVLDEGRLIDIDTGITAFYGGQVAYLEIRDGVPIPHTVERSQPPPRQDTQ